MFKKQISRKIVLVSVLSTLVLSKNSFNDIINKKIESKLKNTTIKKHFLLNNTNSNSPQYMFYKINKTLKLNDSSVEVSSLQRLLQWLGYFDNKINGLYDVKTENSVKNLKEALNLNTKKEVSPEGCFC
jgi:hypothetical protein